MLFRKWKEIDEWNPALEDAPWVVLSGSAVGKELNQLR